MPFAQAQSGNPLTDEQQPAISVGPHGTGVLTFDSLPRLEWTTLFLYGGSSLISGVTAWDATAQALAASDITNALTMTATFPPATAGPPIAARWNSAGHFLQTRAAGGSAALVFMATLRNDTGFPQSHLDVSYDTAVYAPVSAELPGYRVYYSLTGASNRWQFIPELSGIETNGRLGATLSIGAWTNSGLLYLLWIDDNADGATDPGYTIDNFVVEPPPLLGITRVNASFAEITWPLPSLGYILESASDVGNEDWGAVSETDVPAGDFHRVRVEIGETKLFRLRKGP